MAIFVSQYGDTMPLLLELYFILFTAFMLWIFLEPQLYPKNLPPGPLRLPIIGNLLQVALAGKKGRNAPYHKFQQLTKEFGPVTFLKLGVLNNVLLEDIDLIKELMGSEIWVDRQYDNWRSQRAFGKTLGVLMISGPVWKEMRRFSVRTLRDFGFGKQKSMETAIQEELNDLMSVLSKRISIANEIDDKGVFVNMRQYFTISVLNILWGMIAGTRFSHDNEELQKLLTVMDKSMRANAIGSFTMTLYTSFPFLQRFLPKLLNHGAERTELFSELHQFFRDILHERRIEGSYLEDERDFIDVFLKEIDAHAHESPDTNLYTDDQFVILCMDLFMAGSETTANTLEFAILYMILHPEVQQKVQAEIDSVIGNSRFPSIMDRPRMPYTEATLLEVQRLSSVVPIVIRSPTQETSVGKYTVPKGTVGIINIYGAHMNEKVFPNPQEFKPERFLDSENNVVNAHKIIPFGHGKRVCLGEVLAKTSLFVFFTSFLQRFSFDVYPYRPKPTMTQSLGFTLTPEPYRALVKQRL